MAIGAEDGVFVLYSNYRPANRPSNARSTWRIARYDANGARDPSYGAGPGSLLQVARVHRKDRPSTSPSGLTAAPRSPPTTENAGGVIVARFDARGAPRRDLRPCGPGACSALDTLEDTPVRVAVQADGKIVVAGEGGDIGRPAPGLLQRYLTDGQFDPGFGTGGAVTIPLTTKSRPADMLLDPTGRITIAAPLCCKGSSGAPVPTEGVSVVRLLPDGRPDWRARGYGRSCSCRPPGRWARSGRPPWLPDGGLFLGVEEAAPPVESRIFTVGQRLQAPTGWRPRHLVRGGGKASPLRSGGIRRRQRAGGGPRGPPRRGRRRRRRASARSPACEPTEASTGLSTAAGGRTRWRTATPIAVGTAVERADHRPRRLRRAAASRASPGRGLKGGHLARQMPRQAGDDRRHREAGRNRRHAAPRRDRGAGREGQGAGARRRRPDLRRQGARHPPRRARQGSRPAGPGPPPLPVIGVR